MDDAQAASTVKFGPPRSKALAMRPAMTFESSPGIESSVMLGKPCLKRVTQPSSTASRISSGRAANSGTSASAACMAGVKTRSVELSRNSPPPIELPRMTATRDRSMAESPVTPASSRAWPTASSAIFWTGSIEAATFGGIRYFLLSNRKSVTKAPTFA